MLTHSHTIRKYSKHWENGGHLVIQPQPPETNLKSPCSPFCFHKSSLGGISSCIRGQGRRQDKVQPEGRAAGSWTRPGISLWPHCAGLDTWNSFKFSSQIVPGLIICKGFIFICYLSPIQHLPLHPEKPGTQSQANQIPHPTHSPLTLSQFPRPGLPVLHGRWV